MAKLPLRSAAPSSSFLEADDASWRESPGETASAAGAAVETRSEQASLWLRLRSLTERLKSAYPHMAMADIATNVDTFPSDTLSQSLGTGEAMRALASLASVPADWRRNAPEIDVRTPEIDSELAARFKEIAELGLESEFEDGILSNFDDDIDGFLSQDTTERILFAWGMLQRETDFRHVFYRFVERLGYSPAVSAATVPVGLLLSALEAKIPGVRAAAAHALGNLSDEASVSALRDRSYRERNPMVAEIINRHLQDYAATSPRSEQ